MSHTEHILDVTSSVSVDLIDPEYARLWRCVCGKEHDGDTILRNGKDESRQCECCGRRLYFDVIIKVYEIKRDSQ